MKTKNKNKVYNYLYCKFTFIVCTIKLLNRTLEFYFFYLQYALLFRSGLLNKEM